MLFNRSRFRLTYSRQTTAIVQVYTTVDICHEYGRDLYALRKWKMFYEKFKGKCWEYLPRTENV